MSFTFNDNLSKFFAELYHKNDSNNKNKFKFGKCVTDLKSNSITIYIYGKPRGNYFNRHFNAKYFNHVDCDKCDVFTYNYVKTNTSVGGFKILWNVMEDTIQYECASTIMPCGCYSSSVTIYKTNKIPVEFTPKYSDLKKALFDILNDKNLNNNKFVRKIENYVV